MASQRKPGATDSETRRKLLDAAEKLMIEEGYAAVTSRHVGREADVAPQLVHYYFRTMDDLFVEVFRRRAEEGIALFEQAMAEECSLQSIWAFRSGTVGAAYNIEFAALANHRKVIRAELARYAERFRALQLDALAAVLAERDGPAVAISPNVLLLAMTGVIQVMAIEEALGLADGHVEMLAFIDEHLDVL
ncbi:TetR/AcrR family transcriptional regulator [Aquihabitans sp. McL0605]|uniref:TetR/AcrR family transcriptional regulator n=1 Tax=Aquihabitans sp. McL0605 TaxID=3415671 RepID=UPI003CFB9EA7